MLSTVAYTFYNVKTLSKYYRVKQNIDIKRIWHGPIE